MFSFQGIVLSLIWFSRKSTSLSAGFSLFLSDKKKMREKERSKMFES